MCLCMWRGLRRLPILDLAPEQWRSQPDFWSCYPNISVFMDRENNQFCKEMNNDNDLKFA